MDAGLSIDQKQEQVLLYQSGELAAEEAWQVEQWLSQDEELRLFYQAVEAQQSWGAEASKLGISTEGGGKSAVQHDRARTFTFYHGLAAASALLICIWAWPSGETQPHSVAESDAVIALATESVAEAAKRPAPSYSFRKKALLSRKRRLDVSKVTTTKKYFGHSGVKRTLDRWRKRQFNHNLTHT